MRKVVYISTMIFTTSFGTLVFLFLFVQAIVSRMMVDETLAYEIEALVGTMKL